jgi:hypothetical protein
MAVSKLRCSVCGDSVDIQGQHIIEHNYKYSGVKIVCYGSFLPVFCDVKGNMQIGPVMYISRKRRLWDEDDDE